MLESSGPIGKKRTAYPNRSAIPLANPEIAGCPLKAMILRRNLPAGSVSKFHVVSTFGVVTTTVRGQANSKEPRYERCKARRVLVFNDFHNSCSIKPTGVCPGRSENHESGDTSFCIAGISQAVASVEAIFKGAM